MNLNSMVCKSHKSLALQVSARRCSSLLEMHRDSCEAHAVVVHTCLHCWSSDQAYQGIETVQLYARLYNLPTTLGTTYRILGLFTTKYELVNHLIHLSDIIGCKGGGHNIKWDQLDSVQMVVMITPVTTRGAGYRPIRPQYFGRKNWKKEQCSSHFEVFARELK